MELVYVSIISLVGAIIVTQLLQMNYFKKEQFKFKLWQTKKVDTIKMKKLEKDLGVDKKSRSGSGINNLDIPALIDQFTNRDPEEDPESSWITNAITQVASENPQLVQKILSGVTGGSKQTDLEPEEFKNATFET